MGLLIKNGRVEPNCRQAHGGNRREIGELLGVDPEGLIDFSVNINPYGPSPLVAQALSETDVHCFYPELNADSLSSRIASGLGLRRQNVLPGNGSAELLYWLAAFKKPSAAVIVSPSFADYRLAVEANSGRVVQLRLSAREDFRLNWAELDAAIRVAEADLVVLGHPNNPTGKLLDVEELLATAAKHESVVFLIDEAFIDFAPPGAESASFVPRCRNLFILRSFTKIQAIPDVRLGYLIGDERAMASLASARPPWPLSQKQIRVGIAAADDHDFISRSRTLMETERKGLFKALATIPGLRPYQSDANFILIELPEDAAGSSTTLLELAKKGALVRDCLSFKDLGERFIRVAVLDKERNKKLIEAMKGHFMKEERLG